MDTFDIGELQQCLEEWHRAHAVNSEVAYVDVPRLKFVVDWATFLESGH